MTYKLIDIDESYTELETQDIHTKKRVIDTLSVFVEGYQFSPAFRAGIWNGKKEFYTIGSNKNIRFLKGLVQYIISDLVKHGHEYTYESTFSTTDITFEEFNIFVETLKLPFTPYDYQIKASYDMVKDRRGVFSAATSSGKSLILYIFLMWLYRNNKKSILVVPSISLTLQMKGDFEQYGLENSDEIIKLIGGEFNNKDLSTHPIVVSTWQSLQYMNTKDFEVFDVIAVDEAHSVRGDVLSSIVNYATNAQWKVGVTGTVPRVRVDKLQLLGTLGKVYKVINPQGLIERGLATPVFINLLYLNYNQVDKSYYHKQKMKYQDEEKYISEHYSRNMKVSQVIKKLTQREENVLTLFNKIEHGKLLLKNAIELKTKNSNFILLDKLTPMALKNAIELWRGINLPIYINVELDDVVFKKVRRTISKILSEYDTDLFINSMKSLVALDIYFIYGEVSGTDRDNIRKILEVKKGVQIIASYGTTSTGTNFKNLHHIVLASSTKSFIRLSQTVGRGMRKHESKTAVQVWDCVDDISKETARTKKDNYMLKHSYERIEIYRENGYPLKENEINLI